MAKGKIRVRKCIRDSWSSGREGIGIKRLNNLKRLKAFWEKWENKRKKCKCNMKKTSKNCNSPSKKKHKNKENKNKKNIKNSYKKSVNVDKK